MLHELCAATAVHDRSCEEGHHGCGGTSHAAETTGRRGEQEREGERGKQKEQRGGES